MEPLSGDLDNDDEDEEKEEQEEVEPEVGPPMLTPLSEDAELDGLLPWSAHLSSRLIAQYSLAIVHSCLWPGAHTFSNGRLEKKSNFMQAGAYMEREPRITPQ